MNGKKKISLVIAGIVLLILVAVIGVIASIDINSHKDRIERTVSEAIGLRVRIGGAMGISYFPIGVTAADVHIGNKSGEIISVATLKIGIQLFPLLKKEIKVTRCDLLGPSFNIIRDARGKYNFEGAEKSASGPAEALGIDEIRLSKGSLTYQDRKTGERTELAGLEFAIRNVRIEDISGDIIKGSSFEGSLHVGELQQKDLRIGNISAVVRARKGEFTLKPLTIGMVTTEKSKAGSGIEMHDLSFDLDSLSIADFSGDIVKGASLAGTVECREVLQKDLRIEKIRVAMKAQKGIYNFNPLTVGILVITGRKQEEKVELKDIKLEARGLEVKGDSGEMIRDIAFTGNVECGEIWKGEFRIENVSGPVKAAEGVYHLEPFAAAIFGGRAEGDAGCDLSGAVDTYKIKVKISGLDFEKLTEAFGKKKVIGGKGDIIASVFMKHKEGRDIMSSLDGEFALHGDNLLLYSMDLDKVLARFEETQNFNLIDLGAFFIAGPLGTAATKGIGYGSLYAGAQGGHSTIRELVSNWKIKKGIADSTDCALATQNYRVALKGKLDLVRERYENVIVAILNSRGCARFSQKISGPFGDPQIGAVSTIQSIAGPIINLLSKAKDLLEGGRCELFYKGSVRHPR